MVSGRAIKAVAPNSPRETAAENPAPTATARAAMGRSISRKTRQGPAPNTEAASRNPVSIERSMGVTARTTKGMATRAWARGTNMTVARRSTGRSSATSMPNPTVTAEAPRGSISRTSNHRDARPLPETITTEAHNPTVTAISTVARAYQRELAMARPGATAKGPGSARNRQPAPPPRSDRTTSITSGRERAAKVPATANPTPHLSPGVEGRRRFWLSGMSSSPTDRRSW